MLNKCGIAACLNIELGELDPPFCFPKNGSSCFIHLP
jgi:hypothetical protein